MIVIEQKTGTVWNAQKTLGGYGRPVPAHREYWVMYQSGPSSAAQPGVVGFYSAQGDIENQLGNI